MGGYGGSMGGCPYIGTLGILVNLLLLAFGYWVLRKAVSDKGYSKWVGQSVAWIILLAGLGGIACKAVMCVKQYQQGCLMPPGAMGRMCPVPAPRGEQVTGDAESSSQEGMAEEKEIKVEKRVIRRKKR